MARPKLGDSETERLHIKITADEINAIDDWRYGNKIPSRSEAVRRLCQIALRFNKHGPELLKLVLDALFETEQGLITTKKSATAVTDTRKVDDLIKVVGVALKAQDKVAARQMEAVDAFMTLISEVSQFMTDPEFSAAKVRADELRAREGETETAEIIRDAKKRLWP